MINILKLKYDNDEFAMDTQDFSKFKGTENQKNDEFIKKSSYIILSKMNKRKTALKSKFQGEICVGDWYSFTNYLKVLKINSDSIEVKNQRGMIWTVTNDIVEKMNSANHFEKEIAITRTELVELIEGARDTIF